MKNAKLIWVGKTGEPFIQAGVEHYLERIRPYLPMEVVEIRAQGHSGRQPEQAVKAEGDEILKRLKPDETVVLLDERGEMHNSRQFAAWLEGRRSTVSQLSVIIGGAYGVDARVRQRADKVISLSRLTFPHQLVRVIILEQLYRAHTLMAGHQYHHD